MGGTDDPSNLIKLTIEEHAEAHKVLYEKYRKKEDLVAWKALSGQIGKDELLLETSRLGGLKNKGLIRSEEHRKNLSTAISKAITKWHAERKKSDISTDKISNSMIGNKNSKNHSSNEYKQKQSDAMKEAWKRRKQRELDLIS